MKFFKDIQNFLKMDVGIHNNRYSGKQDFELLQNKIDYHFKNRDLMLQALKHRSYLSISKEDRIASNERLEFFGDAVLNFVITKHLFYRFPEENEGFLTEVKSRLVSRKTLVRCGESLQIGQFVLISEAEEKTGGRNRPSILADTIESLIAAIYLDGGFSEVETFVERFICSELDVIISDENHANNKSKLLEYSQSNNLDNPNYSVIDESGPDHRKQFTIEVTLNGCVMGKGKGSNKKQAEQLAAKEALSVLDRN